MKKCINYAPTKPQETSIEESPFCKVADIKPTTSLKINPARDISHRFIEFVVVWLLFKSIKSV